MGFWVTIPIVKLKFSLGSETEARSIVTMLAPRIADGAVEVCSLMTGDAQEAHASVAAHSAILQRFIGQV
ncbi:MAG: hypothetical protein M3R21_10455 [Candidatus Dormibacteraeota bacterium]|nr:hypothetical protein [Candidatus Dormibacteraeota bacterium]